MQAVNLLDDNKKGKANFFILDKLKEGAVETRQPSDTISALSVIEVDDQYENWQNIY